MGKKLTKFLNAISFGHLNRKAKKEALKQSQNSNDQLTLNTVALPDVNLLVGALGNIENIVTVSATISTITVEVTNLEKVNMELLKKISTKGVIKSMTNVTLIIGDCAMALKDKILELKK
ncbi:MAG: hypothetical protein ACOQNY_02415 [Mycoplasmoidaceae bacterium]